MKRQKIAIIWFHRPGCGYCTQMEPEWERLQTMVPTSVDLKKVNTIEQPAMASDFGVNGVPFIVKVVGNNRQVYNGNRSAEDLLKFCKA